MLVGFLAVGGLIVCGWVGWLADTPRFHEALFVSMTTAALGGVMR